MPTASIARRHVLSVLGYAVLRGLRTDLLKNVKALVRWATGKRLTNRLPKLSLITLSPPLNRGILGLRMGPYMPTPRFLYNLWGL